MKVFPLFLVYKSIFITNIPGSINLKIINIAKVSLAESLFNGNSPHKINGREYENSPIFIKDTQEVIVSEAKFWRQ